MDALGTNVKPEGLIVLGLALAWFVGLLGAAVRSMSKAGRAHDMTQ